VAIASAGVGTTATITAATVAASPVVSHPVKERHLAACGIFSFI
jgi:phosphoribosylcarboxyaminoimidazole (NCAIR) mutase